MARALTGRPPGPVVLIGSDIPGIEPHHVMAAFRALLECCDLVFGPAEDGGYWLIGYPRPSSAIRAFRARALVDSACPCRHDRQRAAAPAHRHRGNA